MVVWTEGTIFESSCSASSRASPFSDVCCGTDTALCPGLTHRPTVTASVGDRAGPVHHTGAGNGDCRKKICHLKKYFTILVIRDIPFWGSQSPFSISPYVFTQGHHIWVFFSQWTRRISAKNMLLVPPTYRRLGPPSDLHTWQVLMICLRHGLWAKPHQSAYGQICSLRSQTGLQHFDVALLTNHLPLGIP